MTPGLRASLAAALDGLICVYKPADLSIMALKRTVTKRIAAHANAAVGWPQLSSIKMPVIEEHESGALVVVGTRKQKDYSEHPLVIGEEWRVEDIRIEELRPMETSSSGICVFGINGGVDELPPLRAKHWCSSHRVEAIMGRETDKHEIKGKVVHREEFAHVTRHKLQKQLDRMKHDYRRVAFEMAEVDMQSSKAYSLAVRGIPRPQLPNAQLIADLQLASFRPPYFALQIRSVGETDAYLRCLIAEIGRELGSAASPARVIRRMTGPFRVEHALLERQLSVQNIVDNVKMMKEAVRDFNYDPEVINEPTRDGSEAAVQHRKEVFDRMVANELQQPDEFDAMRPAWPREYA